MPTYYLHMCDGTGFIEDQEGTELPDEAAAREHAVASARDVMAGDMRRGELDLSSFIEVEDAAHKLLFTLSFRDAVAIKNDEAG